MPVEVCGSPGSRSSRRARTPAPVRATSGSSPGAASPTGSGARPSGREAAWNSSRSWAARLTIGVIRQSKVSRARALAAFERGFGERDPPLTPSSRGTARGAGRGSLEQERRQGHRPHPAVAQLRRVRVELRPEPLDVGAVPASFHHWRIIFCPVPDRSRSTGRASGASGRPAPGVELLHRLDRADLQARRG